MTNQSVVGMQLAQMPASLYGRTPASGATQVASMEMTVRLATTSCKTEAWYCYAFNIEQLERKVSQHYEMRQLHDALSFRSASNVIASSLGIHLVLMSSKGPSSPPSGAQPNSSANFSMCCNVIFNLMLSTSSTRRGGSPSMVTGAEITAARSKFGLKERLL
mmetsp:Transcript_109261/g.217024  ORF Transcript_109261/g.217024 Transcript_109261/m.217024 type:complete len:162 (+) Transcript_109261:158-643(+)